MAAISILAVAGPAAGAPRSAHIICPQGQQQPNVVPPCCPLPPQPAGARVQPICCQNTGSCCQTACCPPMPCVPASPTITSSPNPSTAGQKVMLSGTAATGAQVALWRKLVHQSSFHQVSTTTTDGSGHYTFTLKRGTVMADQEWYVTSSGGQSATVAQLVKAVVAVSSSARSTVVGHAIVLRGHVTPSHAGNVVLVEMSRGSTWQVIARPRLGRGSGYSVTHRFATSGVVKLRVVLQRDSRNVRSTSPTVTVTVKS